MISRIGMAPRQPGFTTDSFVRHWRTTHADAAAKIPNLRGYTQLHPVLVGGRIPLPYPGFDACSILDFDDLDAMDEGFRSALYQDEVAADERGFVDKQRFSLLLAEPRRHRPIEPGAVVLATLVRRHPAVPADDRHQRPQGVAIGVHGGHLDRPAVLVEHVHVKPLARQVQSRVQHVRASR